MKKIVLFIMAVFVFIGVNAQDKQKSKALELNQYYFNFSFGTADNLTATADTYGIYVLTNKAEPVKYDVVVELDSVSGTPATAIKLQGKIFDADTWSDITTVNWAASSSDTIVKFSEHSTAAYYRYLRVYLDMDETEGNEALVTKTTFKLWDK